MSKIVVPVAVHAYSRIVVEAETLQDARDKVELMIQDGKIEPEDVFDSEACECDTETGDPWVLEMPDDKWGCINVEEEN